MIHAPNLPAAQSTIEEARGGPLVERLPRTLGPQHPRVLLRGGG
jgi:hypothetical protein